MKKRSVEKQKAPVTRKSILSLIGLSMRQGAVGSGEYLTEKTVKEGRAFLVLVAEDASANTKKNFQDMCKYYHVPIHIFGSKDELGHAIGKEFRASLALTNHGLSERISDDINTLKTNEAGSIPDLKHSKQHDVVRNGGE